MKRPKSKRYKSKKAMIGDFVANLVKRKRLVIEKQKEEERKDKEFVQKNRLVLEINQRHNFGGI